MVYVLDVLPCTTYFTKTLLPHSPYGIHFVVLNLVRASQQTCLVNDRVRIDYHVLLVCSLAVANKTTHQAVIHTA